LALSEENVRQLGIQLQQANDRGGQLGVEIAGLRSNLAEATERIVAADVKIGELTNRLVNDDQQINQLNAGLQAKAEDNRQLQRQIDQLVETRNSLQEKVGALEKKLTDAVLQRDQLQRAVNNFVSERRDDQTRTELMLSQASAAWQAEKAKLETDRQQAVDSVERAQRELRTCKEELASRPSPPP
jgi:chromosome segregation ATPase